MGGGDQFGIINSIGPDHKLVPDSRSRHVGVGGARLEWGPRMGHRSIQHIHHVCSLWHRSITAATAKPSLSHNV